MKLVAGQAVSWILHHGSTRNISPVPIAVEAALTTALTLTKGSSVNAKREPYRFPLFFVEELIWRFLGCTVLNRYKDD